MILSFCTHELDISFSPQSHSFDVQAGDFICANSSIPRSIYVIGASPDNVYIRSSMGSKKHQVFTDSSPLSEDNTIFFAAPDETSLEVEIQNPGTLTISTVGLGNTQCLSGIAVTNQVQGDNINDLILSPSETRCYFFGSYGKQIIFFQPKLDENDKFNYQCGNGKISETSHPTNDFTLNCLLDQGPLFSSLNTTNAQCQRSLKFTVTTENTIAPKFQQMIERPITPTPEPQSGGGMNPGIIAVIAIGSLAVFVLFFVMIITLYKQKMKRDSIEGMTGDASTIDFHYSSYKATDDGPL